MSVSQIIVTGGRMTAEFIGAVFAADFVAGFIHWAEDAYGYENTPILGKWVVEANVLHHREPRAFVKKNWLQSSWDITLASALIVLVAWLTGHLHWPVLVFAVLTANANEIHKWAHRTPRENGKIITWLQRMRLVQTVRHHAKHHTNPKDSNYCTVTNYLNPVLDGINFWEGLETIILHTVGLRRRIDPTVKPRVVKVSGILPGHGATQVRKCSGHCGRERICGNVSCPAFALRQQASDRALAQSASGKGG
jgi:ubiquitin-conjugating enzyme E2 variant